MAASDTNRVGAEPEYRPMRDAGTDHTMRNMALAAVGLAALVMGGVYVLSGHHHAGIPVIEADTRPLRIKPTDPGGMQIANADDQLPTGTGETDQLAPPPEAPAPQALREAAAAASTSPPPVAPAAAPLTGSMPPASLSAAPPPLPDSRQVASAAEPKLAPPPPISRAVTRSALHLGHDTGHTEVQLAALDSESAANSAWESIGRRSPGLLEGHAPRVAKVQLAGKTYWRLRTGGFADTAEATQFCAKLRAKGEGCAIASF